MYRTNSVSFMHSSELSGINGAYANVADITDDNIARFGNHVGVIAANASVFDRANVSQVFDRQNPEFMRGHSRHEDPNHPHIPIGVIDT